MKARICAKGILKFIPGGYYDMAEGNSIEHRIAKLHLLQDMIDDMVEDLCNTSENRVHLGSTTELVAEQLYMKYKPMVEAGYNVFDLADHHNPKMLEKYAARPVVNRFGNAGPTEGTRWFPEGWWFDYGYVATKMFETAYFIIGTEELLRVDYYDPASPTTLKEILEGCPPGNIVASWTPYNIHEAKAVLTPEVYNEVQHAMAALALHLVQSYGPISNLEEAQEFLKYLAIGLGPAAFHPDNRLQDLSDAIFTAEEAKRLDILMEVCFVLFQSHSMDIYTWCSEEIFNKMFHVDTFNKEEELELFPR